MSTTLWHKCWPWSSTNTKIMLITTPFAPPWALPPTKSTSDACRTPTLTVFDRSYGDAHQNLDRDLAYCDLARERQKRAYELVQEQHALTVARVYGRNSALSDALLRCPKYTAGGWIWVYNTTATICQGLRKGADNKVFKVDFSLNWTGPFKIIAVGPFSAADTPDGHPLGDKLLYLNPPSNLSDPAAKPRVTVTRCKPCANPYDADDIPRHLPAGLTQYQVCPTRLRDQVASIPRHHG